MAQFFAGNSNGEWSVIPVPSEGVRITGDDTVQVEPMSVSQSDAGRDPEIRRSAGAAREIWALLIPLHFQIWVNGRRASQMRILRHRDSIWVRGNDPLFFSTEKLAEVEVFTGREDRVDCARCKSEIRTGQRAVSCPDCGTYHHSDASIGLECWSYAPHCCGCNYSTDLNDDLRWVP